MRPTVDTLTERDVLAAFQGIAPDLAQACLDAGEEPRVHYGDLADAIYNHLAVAGDTMAAFKKIKRIIRKSLCHGGGTWIRL